MLPSTNRVKLEENSVVNYALHANMKNENGNTKHEHNVNTNKLSDSDKQEDLLVSSVSYSKWNIKLSMKGEHQRPYQRASKC